MLQETRQALKQVKEANEVKNNFLALASHELRTPLGIIMGYSQFLKEDTKDETQKLAGQVLDAARQMRTILDAMSNLTMLKAETLSLAPQRTVIQDVLTFACEGIKEIASTRDQKLVFAFPEEPLHVNVDIDKTSLAFINVLNNALLFSPQGSMGTPGWAEKSSISLFSTIPVPGITTLEPNVVLTVAVIATQFPSASIVVRCVVCFRPKNSDSEAGGMP
jgi:signal transduction histidine kinase